MNLDVSVAPEIAQLMGPGPNRSRERPAAPRLPQSPPLPRAPLWALGPPAGRRPRSETWPVSSG